MTVDAFASHRDGHPTTPDPAAEGARGVISAEHELTPGDPRSVARGRALVSHDLQVVAPHLPLDDVLVATSELVTNAVTAATSAVRLAVELEPGCARVAVYDDGPGVPRAARSTPDLAHGRGLSIVECLAARWGVRAADRGKWVWAEFPVTRVGSRSAGRTVGHPVG